MPRFPRKFRVIEGSRVALCKTGCGARATMFCSITNADTKDGYCVTCYERAIRNHARENILEKYDVWSDAQNVRISF